MSRFVAHRLSIGHKVRIFSNFPAQAAPLFPGASVTTGTTEIDDIVSIARFRHVLIPPSTFSIWAVYLRKDPKTVYLSFEPVERVRRQSLKQLGDMPWVTLKSARQNHSS